ncbi:MAG: hypothetical protein IJZ44_01725 [Lachnospiraceae bacterium]|nr:hypothetical protein [Lachnospiraceae bacterium]
MIALEIKNIKEFMNQLLGSEAFDSFYLEEASITTYNTFFIDGHTVDAFYDGTDASGNFMEKPAPFSSWKQMRPICFSLIKGNRSPVAFKFVLHAGERYLERLKNNPDASVNASHIKALAVNIRFEGNTLKCITGTSYDTFIMDKTIDNIWDGDFVSSLTAMGIKFELL